MIEKQIKALEAARAKVAQIEKNVEAARLKELASLPSKYGFTDTASFIKAVKAAAGGKKSGVTASGKRRKRAIIDDQTKALVKKLAGEGKTGAEIAETAGISVPSVQNIKKELGLTKTTKRKK